MFLQVRTKRSVPAFVERGTASFFESINGILNRHGRFLRNWFGVSNVELRFKIIFTVFVIEIEEADSYRPTEPVKINWDLRFVGLDIYAES